MINAQIGQHQNFYTSEDNARKKLKSFFQRLRKAFVYDTHNNTYQNQIYTICPRLTKNRPLFARFA